MPRIWIPEVPLEVIHKRSLQIKPLVRCSSGQLHFVRKRDISKQSYIWNPELLRRVNVDRIVKIAQIPTYHPFDSHDKFIPTVAAVLAQIPEEYVSRTACFEIIPYSYQMSSYIPVKVSASLAGYHTGETILYARR